MNKFESLSAEEEAIGKAVVDSAYIVHKELGPGLLEGSMRFVFVMF